MIKIDLTNFVKKAIENKIASTIRVVSVIEGHSNFFQVFLPLTIKKK